MEKSESADGFEDAAAEATDSNVGQLVDGAEDEVVVEVWAARGSRLCGVEPWLKKDACLA